jgi:hypothetical protein
MEKSEEKALRSFFIYSITMVKNAFLCERRSVVLAKLQRMMILDDGVANRFKE